MFLRSMYLQSGRHLAAAVVAGLLIGPSSGLNPADAEPQTPVQIARLSGQMYAVGLETNDALLILSAARLRKTLAPTAGALTPEGAVAATGAPLGWEEMLTQAQVLAGEDEILLGLIADARVEATKGVASGPVYNIASLASGKSDSYPAVAFVGGEYAEVYVEARSATDLNLTVHDAKGRLVCSDTDKSPIAYCGWRPDANGDFVMKVQNRGPGASEYALMTN